MRLTSKLLAATAVAAVAAAVVISPATADPTVTPAAIDIVSVGSDTIQVLDNKISTDFNATAPASKYYSYDATGSATIAHTKTGSVANITRPNGSGAGVTALTTYSHTTVDIARSSRGPKSHTGGDPVTDLFIAFAKDAVGWSGFTTVTGHTTHSPTTLSVADLQGIYGSCSITKWNQITDIPGFTGSTATIKAYLPQASSGTRSFFLSALGITTPGTCVQTVTPEENEGSNAAFVNNVDAVFPYSVAHYVGQKYKGKGSGTDVPGALDALRSIKFSSTSTIAQVNTTAKTINAPFSISIFGRNVYHVVRSADWNDATLGARLKKLLDTSAHSGWICKSGTADVTGYGFLALPTAQCGVITHSVQP